MIDDKKIEAAANKHIETEYARYNSGEVEEEMICLRDKDSFKAGANWMQEEFLKNLWHPASEEPKKGRVFLYKTIFKGYGLNQIIDGNEWKYIIKYQKATQWLYIDDLLPKEGGNQ